MSKRESARIALVMQTRIENNVGILKGISAYERDHANWNFFLDDQAMGVKDPDWLFRQEWDGVVCRHENDALIQACVELGIPVVDLDDSERVIDGVPKVRPDNRAIGHLGAEHFLDRGFKHFGFCGFNTTQWSIERREGFVEAVETVGLTCMVHETPYSDKVDPDWDLSEREQIKTWLQTIPQPAAIMACFDVRALQVIGAIDETDYSVPDGFAVLGVNNETVRAELSHPPLSSISLNPHDWGYRAAEQLHLQLKEEDFRLNTFIDPLPVVVRRSTDSLAIEDTPIVKALKIIHDEACQNLRVDDLAKRVNVSRSLLERRFRKFLRRTPQEEIRNVKINRTKRYLIETDKTLAEIAELTGFDHPEYLTVMFKRLTGENPREFRQRHKNPEPIEEG